MSGSVVKTSLILISFCLLVIAGLEVSDHNFKERLSAGSQPAVERQYPDAAPQVTDLPAVHFDQQTDSDAVYRFAQVCDQFLQTASRQVLQGVVAILD